MANAPRVGKNAAEFKEKREKDRSKSQSGKKAVKLRTHTEAGRPRGARGMERWIQW